MTSAWVSWIPEPWGPHSLGTLHRERRPEPECEVSWVPLLIPVGGLQVSPKQQIHTVVTKATPAPPGPGEGESADRRGFHEMLFQRDQG